MELPGQFSTEINSEINVTPHVTQNINEHRGSNFDARTTRHPGYQISLVVRKGIEGANGWIMTIGSMQRARPAACRAWAGCSRSRRLRTIGGVQSGAASRPAYDRVSLSGPCPGCRQVYWEARKQSEIPRAL